MLPVNDLSKFKRKRSTKVVLKGLVEASKKLYKFKQGSNRFPEKYRLEYDVLFLEKHKKTRKGQIKKLTKDLIEKEFWLKYNPKLLEKKLNELILPSIIKNELTPTGTQAQLEFDAHVYPVCKKSEENPWSREDRYASIDKALAKLDPIDAKIIRMKFGIAPDYDREYKYVEIAKEVGINNAQLSKRLKKVLGSIKEDLQKCLDEIPDDPYYDEDVYRYFNGIDF